MASKTDEMFTRDAVKAAGAVEVKAMVTSLKTKISNHKRSDLNIRIAAAYTMWGVFATREAVNATDLAKEIGTARTNIYFWKRLGTAVVDLGVEPNTEEWTLLNSTANVKVVAGVLDGNGRDGKGDGKVPATIEDLRWALDLVTPPVKDDDGNVVMEGGKVKRDKRRTTDEINAALIAEGLAEEEAKSPEQVQAEIDKDAKNALDRLLMVIGKTSDDQWIKLGASISNLAKITKERGEAYKEAQITAATGKTAAQAKKSA